MSRPSVPDAPSAPEPEIECRSGGFPLEELGEPGTGDPTKAGAGPAGEVARMARFCSTVSAQPTLWWYPDGEIWHANQAACELLGRNLSDLLGRSLSDLEFRPSDGMGWVRALRRARCGGKVRMEGLVRAAEGEMVPLDLTVRCFLIDGGEFWCAEARPWGSARWPGVAADPLHEPLTGLPNRVLFLDRLQQAVEWSRRNRERSFAVLLLDLDRFHRFNESLGHARGDDLLVKVGQRLVPLLRSTDTLAHFGGDRFALLLEDIVVPQGAVRVAERVQDSLLSPLVLGGHELYVTASQGIAFHRADVESPEQFVHEAEAALSRAQDRGGRQHIIYDEAMHVRAQQRLELETGLRRAVDRSELELHYQPIVTLGDGRVQGFEALLRWHHPTRGVLLPADFLDVAEETGLTIPIGDHVLRQVADRLCAWRRLRPKDSPFISINLSPRQFHRADLVERVAGLLAVEELEPRCLALELTEGILMAGNEQVASQISALRDLGVRLFLDDFGTGYSSLASLHLYPFERVKIDRSFISRLNGSLGLVEAIVALSRQLSMGVIAEGIETEEQAAAVLGLGCEMGQGWHLSHPLTAADVDGLMEEGSTEKKSSNGRSRAARKAGRRPLHYGSLLPQPGSLPHG